VLWHDANGREKKIAFQVNQFETALPHLLLIGPDKRQVKKHVENHMRFQINRSWLLAAMACGFAATSAHACHLGFGMKQQPAAAAIKMPSAILGDPDKMPPHEPTIVGLWNSEFLGVDGSDDKGFDSFYADGNELLVDNSAPATDNVCSGVWEQTGPRTYNVNHPSWDFDLFGNLVGIVVLSETITVDKNGNKFKGTGSVTVYDPILSTIVYQTTGTLTGTRITAKSSPL